MQKVKVQASLYKQAVSQEPLLFVHTAYRLRRSLRQRAKDGWCMHNRVGKIEINVKRCFCTHIILEKLNTDDDSVGNETNNIYSLIWVFTDCLTTDSQGSKFFFTFGGIILWSTSDIAPIPIEIFHNEWYVLEMYNKLLGGFLIATCIFGGRSKDSILMEKGEKLKDYLFDSVDRVKYISFVSPEHLRSSWELD